MGFALLADLLVAAHLAFVVFVAAGGLLVLRFRRLLVPHLAAAGWGAFVAATNRVCPLTPLENACHRLAGEAGYGEGFLDHYLAPILYPPGLTPETQQALAVAVVAVNAAVYGFVVRRWRRA